MKTESCVCGCFLFKLFATTASPHAEALPATDGADPSLSLPPPSAGTMSDGADTTRLLADEEGKASLDLVPASPSAARAMIAKFPPLPLPHSDQRTEAAGGTIFVLLLVGGMVGVTYYTLLSHLNIGGGGTAAGAAGSVLPRGAIVTLLALISLEACVALFSLGMILFGNPGVIRRSEATCFPLPLNVEEWVNRGAQPGDLADAAKNIKDGERSFCVRCLVWRGPAENTPGREAGFCASSCKRAFPHPACHYNASHHCSTCQRCVKEHDHHCGVFGRCITGGNMSYFISINAMAVFGFLTCIASVLISVTFTAGVPAGPGPGGGKGL